MKKVNKMLLDAKRRANKRRINNAPVHIVEQGYCYSCKGPCKYEEGGEYEDLGEGIVIIYGDLPDDDGFADAPIETLKRIVELTEEECE